MTSQLEDLDGEFFRSDKRCAIDNCRSKKYRRAEDGLLYCSYGHQSSDPHQITVDEQDFRDPSQRVSKTKKDYKKSEGSTSFFAGAEAVEQYLRCYQGALHKQAQWLVANSGFPAEFDGVVKDLWTLRLQMLDPLIRKAADERVEPQMYSSQIAGSDGERGPRKVASVTSALHLDDCLGMLYLAAVLLQLPVMIRDVHAWIKEETFPYLRVEQHVSGEVFQRLPLPYRRTFQNRFGPPAVGEVHRVIISFANTYMQSSTPLQWPPLNMPPILFRVVTEAALPVETFPAVLKLASCLQLSFSLSSLKTSYKHLSDHPELQLLALLVIIVKLLYPFDGIARSPSNSSDPAALVLEWQQWTEVFVKHPVIGSKDEEEPKEKESADNWNVHEQDVLDMDEEQIDDYLDWFQQTWIDENKENHGRASDYQKDLNSLFPLGARDDRTPPAPKTTSEDHSTAGRLKRVQATLTYQPPARRTHGDDRSTSKTSPGSRYKQYRSVKDIPDVAMPFFELIAHLGAVSVDMLVSAVFRMERRLRRWDESEAKKTGAG